MSSEGWQSALMPKCSELTPAEADALFFVGRGGKPHKAEAYCSDCPLLAQCLVDAIQYNLVGFWAGTTDEQRRDMAPWHNIRVLGLGDFMPVEPDPDVRVVYLKVFTQPDSHEWMDEVEPSESEILAMEVG